MRHHIVEMGQDKGNILKVIFLELCPFSTFLSKLLFDHFENYQRCKHEILNTSLSSHGTIVKQVTLFWKQYFFWVMSLFYVEFFSKLLIKSLIWNLSKISTWNFEHLLIITMEQLQGNGHHSESNIFIWELCPFPTCFFFLSKLLIKYDHLKTIKDTSFWT